MKPYQVPEDDQEFARLYRTAYLIAAFIEERLTPAEREELDDWVGASRENLVFFEEATDEKKLKESLAWFRELDVQKARRRVIHRIQQREPGRRQSIFSLAIAACMVLLAGLGIVMFFYSKKQATPSQASHASTQAVMLLANGKKIFLDSVADGRLAGTGQFQFTKKGNEIVVGGLADIEGDQGMNSISVPQGKEYQLVLFDGSRVQLNAGSSLQFPYAFHGKERKVQLDGEAYFEVSKSKDQSFIVSAGQSEVQVLGTHFNVKAYSGEAAMLTTLVEGSVQVRHDGNSILLKPGNQSKLENGKLELIEDADLEQALAWRSGQFIFRDTPLDEVMRSLERWYGITVINEDKKNEHFNGSFSKDLPLEKILHYLEQTNRVRFEIKDKKVTVRT